MMTIEQKQLKVKLEKLQTPLSEDQMEMLRALGVLKDLEVGDEFGPKLVAAQEAVKVAEKVYVPAEKIRVEDEKKRLQMEKDLAAAQVAKANKRK